MLLPSKLTGSSLLLLISLFSLYVFMCSLVTQVNAAIPNTCLRCDFLGGKKVKPCTTTGLTNTTGIEVAECSYEKPYCGITINVTDYQHHLIHAGCYSKAYKKYCFLDRVWHYGPLNTTYCYHTCPDYFCNPHLAWLAHLATDSDLRPNTPR